MQLLNCNIHYDRMKHIRNKLLSIPLKNTQDSNFFTVVSSCSAENIHSLWTDVQGSQTLLDNMSQRGRCWVVTVSSNEKYDVIFFGIRYSWFSFDKFWLLLVSCPALTSGINTGKLLFLHLIWFHTDLSFQFC